MAIEHLIWKFLSKRRFGTFLACLLIPECLVFEKVHLKIYTPTQRVVWAGVGAAIGLLAFALLSTHDWLRQAIKLRRSRSESVNRLVLVQWLLYLFVLPFLLVCILLVVVACYF